ncbi:MAG: hypothetical protein VX597_04505 [Pseudomonadota bacterium]|nr:hypothetical protein [Pseudomonadota bacterium]
MKVFWPLVICEPRKALGLIFITAFTVGASLAPAVLILALFTKYLPYPNNYTLIILILVTVALGVVGLWAEKIRFELAATSIHSFCNAQKGKIREFLKSEKKSQISQFYFNQNFSTDLYEGLVSNIYPPQYILKIFDFIFYIFLFLIFVFLFTQFAIVFLFICVFFNIGKTFIIVWARKAHNRLETQKRLVDHTLDVLEGTLVKRYFLFLKQEYSSFCLQVLVVILYGAGCYLVALEELQIGILIASALIFSKIFNCFSGLDEFIRAEISEGSKLRTFFSFQEFIPRDSNKLSIGKIDYIYFQNFQLHGSVSPPINLKLYPGQALAFVTEQRDFFNAFKVLNIRPELGTPDSVGLGSNASEVPWTAVPQEHIGHYDLADCLNELRTARKQQGGLKKIAESLDVNIEPGGEPFDLQGSKLAEIVEDVFVSKKKIVILDIQNVIHEDQSRVLVEKFLNILSNSGVFIIFCSDDKDLIKKSNYSVFID